MIGAWGLHYGIKKSWVRYYPTYEQAKKAIFSNEVCADIGVKAEDIISIIEVRRQKGQQMILSINIGGETYLPAIIAFHPNISY